MVRGDSVLGLAGTGSNPPLPTLCIAAQQKDWGTLLFGVGVVVARLRGWKLTCSTTGQL